jgi:hypothetical protein
MLLPWDFESKYAAAKDLSKFYQWAAADLTAQHLRRVVWRNRQTNIQPTIYIIKNVNYRNRPAGCIAITDSIKMAKMYDTLLHRAAWSICHDLC